MDMKKLTLREEAVMYCIWKAKRPVTLSEIISSATAGNDWKVSTTYKTMDSLIEKGYVAETGYIVSGKKLARLFAPQASVEEYSVAWGVDRLMRYKTLNRFSAIQAVVSFLSEESEDNDVLIAELKTIIASLQDDDTSSVTGMRENKRMM